MKNLAIACLLGSTQAIRFSETGADLNANEEADLIRPTLIANNAVPHSNEEKGLSFSQGLSKMLNDDEEVDNRYRPEFDQFRDTAYTKKPISQPSEDPITQKEKFQYMRMANEDNKIKYLKEGEIENEEPKQQEPVKSEAQKKYEKQAHSQMFPRYVDNDQLDNRIHGELGVLGIGADDTSAIQLNKLPYVNDVGRREYTDPHSQYEWYPGDRRVYQAIEERFDFAQHNKPGQYMAQSSLPDVGNRDFGAAHALHAWYPGDRRYYNYEGQFDHAQVSPPSRAQLPDVGNRDFGEAHSSHAWYPGDRRYYDFEGKFDHAQRKASHNYAQRY